MNVTASGANAVKIQTETRERRKETSDLKNPEANWEVFYILSAVDLAPRCDENHKCVLLGMKHCPAKVPCVNEKATSAISIYDRPQALITAYDNRPFAVFTTHI